MSEKWSRLVRWLFFNALLVNLVFSAILAEMYFFLKEKDKFLEREELHLKALAKLPKEEIQDRLETEKEVGASVAEFLSQKPATSMKVQGEVILADRRRPDGIEYILRDTGTLTEVRFLAEGADARKLLAALYEHRSQKDVILSLGWDKHLPKGREVRLRGIVKLRFPD